MRDINGREVKPGDLIKSYHYTDRRTRRKCYLYKLVVKVNDNLELDKDGKWWYAMDIIDIWNSNGSDKAFKCLLSVVGDFEIIDGYFDQETWYERKKCGT